MPHNMHFSCSTASKAARRHATGAAGYSTSMDGLTKPLTCDVPVTPGQPVTLRIMIADTADHVYDSAVGLVDRGIWSD